MTTTRFKNAKIRGMFILNGCPECKKEIKTCRKCKELYCMCVDCDCHSHSIINDPIYDEVERRLKTGEMSMSDLPENVKEVITERKKRNDKRT